MLKIGDFSKLGHVTVKALRHYARMGLLKPAWIDRFSGYRYYSLQQLPRLNRILALKDLGFSLEQITGLIDEEVPVEQMRGMLRRKQAELEAHLWAEQKRLDLVAARLQQIEQANGRPGREVLVKTVPSLPVAAVREVVPSIEGLPSCLDALVDELNGWMAQTGVVADGPWLALYPALEYTEHAIPIELAVAVDPAARLRSSPGSSRVRLEALPAVPEMAYLVHAGPALALSQAYAELFAWMEANRRRPSGPTRELYLRDAAEKGPITQVIEIQLPIESVASPASTTRENQKETQMEPTFVTRPAFNVVGLCYHGNNQNDELGKMWDVFNRRSPEVAAVPSSHAYGICRMVEGLPEGHFEYVAGLETPDDAPIPEGMVHRRVEAARYAVFTHRGPLSGLMKTYQRIYNEWIPQYKLEPVEAGLDMEVYTDEFDPNSPDSVFYIYIPVK